VPVIVCLLPFFPLLLFVPSCEMSGSGREQPTQPVPVSLGRMPKPLHVAMFNKMVILQEKQVLRRVVPEYKPYKRRFKPSKKNSILMNFEKRPSEAERKEMFEAKVPWIMKPKDEAGEFKGTEEEGRAGHYALLFPSSDSDKWSLYLLDKWFNFEGPPVLRGKSTDELEAIVSTSLFPFPFSPTVIEICYVSSCRKRRTRGASHSLEERQVVVVAKKMEEEEEEEERGEERTERTTLEVGEMSLTLKPLSWIRMVPPPPLCSCPPLSSLRSCFP